MAPRRTASAFFAAVRASSVNGSPVASIEHCVCLSRSARLVQWYTYSAQQVGLEVELDILAALLDDLEDLSGV